VNRRAAFSSERVHRSGTLRGELEVGAQMLKEQRRDPQHHDPVTGTGDGWQYGRSST